MSDTIPMPRADIDLILKIPQFAKTVGQFTPEVKAAHERVLGFIDFEKCEWTATEDSLQAMQTMRALLEPVATPPAAFIDGLRNQC